MKRPTITKQEARILLWVIEDEQRWADLYNKDQSLSKTTFKTVDKIFLAWPDLVDLSPLVDFLHKKYIKKEVK